MTTQQIPHLRLQHVRSSSEPGAEGKCVVIVLLSPRRYSRTGAGDDRVHRVSTRRLPAPPPTRMVFAGGARVWF